MILEELFELLTFEVCLVVGVFLDGVLVVDTVILIAEELLEGQHRRLAEALLRVIPTPLHGRGSVPSNPQRTVRPSTVVIPAVFTSTSPIVVSALKSTVFNLFLSDKGSSWSSQTQNDKKEQKKINTFRSPSGLCNRFVLE